MAGEVALHRTTSAGRNFVTTLSVRPAEGESLRTCRNVPSKKTTCETADLAAGRTAQAYTMPVDDVDTLGASVLFAHGRSHVLLSVALSERATSTPGASAPVTADQLLDVARDPRFTSLVKYADEHPVQAASEAVRGG